MELGTVTYLCGTKQPNLPRARAVSLHGHCFLLPAQTEPLIVLCWIEAPADLLIHMSSSQVSGCSSALGGMVLHRNSLVNENTECAGLIKCLYQLLFTVVSWKCWGCGFSSASSVGIIVQLSKWLNLHLVVEPIVFGKHLCPFPNVPEHREKHSKRKIYLKLGGGEVLRVCA